MRFWVQAVKLSSSVNYRFIVNDKEVAAGEVFYPRLIFFLALKSRRSRRTRVRPTLIFVSVFCHRQGYKISHDVGTGIIQMTVEQFTRANEGTYTVQINDGKAKTQSSLVLVGDGEDVFTATLRQMNGFLIGGFR